MNQTSTAFIVALTLIFVAFCYCLARIGSGPLSWRLVAWLATRKSVMVWLMRRAFRTPYSHITSADGTDVYMRRFWLFNPYSVETGKRQGEWAKRPWWREMLPSVRLHHIMRADQDRHLHSHPWNARTIILKGWYEEERYSDESPRAAAERQRHAVKNALQQGGTERRHLRIAGYTGRLLFGQYHRITQVPRDGVWTLFITWRKRGSWGFDVDGREVPWREYLAQQQPPSEPDWKVGKGLARDPRMTDRALGAPLEAYLEAGWTKEQLVEHGYMRSMQ